MTIGFPPTDTKNPNWWPQRTALEKSLTLLSTLALVGIIVLALTLSSLLLLKKGCVVVVEKSTTETTQNRGLPLNQNIATRAGKPSSSIGSNAKSDDLCLTPGCIHAASDYLNNMDDAVNPCDDFYSFACGNFVKETVIPDEDTSVSAFSVIGDKMQEHLRTLVNGDVDPNDLPSFNLVKNMYKACMNKSLIEQHGLDALLSITNKLGGWPVVKGDQWDDTSKWAWTRAVRDFRKIGYSTDYIFDIGIDLDSKNSSIQVINIDQTRLGLSRKYLTEGLSNKIVRAYYEYMVDTAVIYGADKKRAERELLDSLNFEIALAKISLPMEERRNASALYNPYSLDEVQEQYPYIQWIQYINALLPDGLSVDEKEIIVVSVPTFFESLGKLLKETPKRTIANYMLWRVTEYSSFFLTEELRKRKLVYNSVITGKQDQEPRWQECINVASGSLNIAAGALYVRKYFKTEARDAALEMVNGITTEFKKILSEVAWMDEKTRQVALNKLHAMTSHIGYPDELMDDSKIEQFYEQLEIDPDNYLQSILNDNVFDTDSVFNQLRKPVNKTDWVTHTFPTVVNAFYSPNENSIQFPAGILQGQFFADNRPKYLNYGGIGSVIGHEMTHGFDDEGSQFDPDGNLVDWWNADTKKKYLKKAKCIIDQYSNYTEPTTGLKVNGVNTQGENIADNGGTKEAYLAYQQWVRENGAEQKLPGLDYTPQQMFWISAAQNWCSVYRTETMRMHMTTDVHSPAIFRVIGPLSNRKEFARDYNCPEGSRMNPVHKCEVW